jgi:GNAT superfamily N-acetyltransferase
VIREATLKDRPEFLRLYNEYLLEERKNGSHLPANLHNLNFFRRYFDAYVLGSLFGACLLWFPEGEEIPRGLALVGEQFDPPGWESDLGRSCFIWGLYVEPPYRGQEVGLQLGQFGIKRGIEMGFKTVETSVRTANNHGENAVLKFGTKPYATYHLANIKELDEKLKEIQNG